MLFDLTQQHWHEEARHPLWKGLTLNAVDGVVWRTPDTPENAAAFAKAENQYGEKGYPQVRMVCLMELSSHLLRASVMDRYDVTRCGWQQDWQNRLRISSVSYVIDGIDWE